MNNMNSDPSQYTAALYQIDQYCDQAHQLSSAHSYGEATAALSSALQLYESVPRMDMERLAVIAQELGNVCFLTGKYKEAENDYQKALDLLEMRWSKDHAKLTQVLDSLAQLYIHEKLFEAALPICKRSLAIKERTKLPADSDVLESMRMCAIVASKTGDFATAEQLLKKAIDILEPSTIGPFEEFLIILANVYHAQQKDDLAEGCYRKALRTFLVREGRALHLARCLKDYGQFLLDTERTLEGKRAMNQSDNVIEALGNEYECREEEHFLPPSADYQRLSYPMSIFH